MSNNVTIEQAVREAIGECAGYVSLCWEPRPTGVFDSTLAAAAVEAAVARTHSAMQEERAAGYAAALAAAREAVAALLAYDSPYGPLIRTMAALAAIDALKESDD